jgi:LPS-assembly protein
VRVKGLPVFYTPLFWHTDPTAKRGSGFLAPRFAIDERRGFSYEQPYLWVISPYADVVLSPQLDTKVTPLLNGEFRERFYSGQVDARFGYTYAQQFDSKGQPYDDRTSRSYILASGAFAPADHWTWGFSAERVTDPLMFQRYSVPNAFDPRGLFPTDDQRLISQIYAVEQGPRSYVSIAAMSFQGLRVGDLNGTFPFVAPLIEAHYEPESEILGGRLRLEGAGVLLQRSRDVTTDTAPGIDSRRATFSGDWRSAFTFYDGIRLEPFIEGRGDVYNVNDVSPTDTGLHTTARALGTAGVDASWPFFRRTGDLTVVLEPLAQLAVSPRAVTNPYIPNEDSQVIDFDETNLFEFNKSPGFDYYEGGARANVGGRASFRWDGGGQAQLLAGRSYRTVPDPTLPARTSLNQTESDWVVAGSAEPFAGLSGFGRALVDSRGEGLRRLEAGFNAGTARLNGYVRYLYDNVDVTSGRTENAQLGGQVLITKRWGLAGSASWDLASHVAVQQSVGLLYQDECTHWELLYVHDGTYNRTLRPSDQIVIRLLLVTLGSSGYQRPDFR